MPANYNNTAWFYDRLSRFIYGDVLHKAQARFLTHIPNKATVLIIGGGTGKILEDIAALHPSELTITYVEIAANMVTLSKKRNARANTVHFLNAAIEDINMPRNFDVVITPFLLDNYTWDTLPQLIAHIGKQLKNGGVWLNTDFQLTGKWWQKLLIKSMYGFFSLFADIKTSALSDIAIAMKGAGYDVLEQKSFYGEFISTEVWHRASAE